MNKKTRRLAFLTLFIAIEVVISIIPFLGFIPLGFMNVTTLHIPVIIAGILLGKKEGAIVGFVFGLMSMINNTIKPLATSFLFSPFISIGEIDGSWQSLIIAFIPRILIGYIAGYIYEKLKNKGSLAIGIAALVGALVNTLLVMSLVYLLFGEAYASAINQPYETIISFILLIVASNGVAEAIAAIVLCIPICKVSKKVIKW